ncbi:MAG: LamG-like jellyroll fold domain-containing protein, partial [Opitutales bacterium]
NDLAVCYNKKGDLHEGAIGQAWRLNGGKRVVPAQVAGDYSKGVTLVAWVKLTDPSKPIPALVGWQNGGTLHYTPGRESYSFGDTTKRIENEKDELEVKNASQPEVVTVMDDGWHLLAVSMDAKFVKIYMDGKLHQERPYHAKESLPAGSIALASSARHPRFYIDELRVYERPLGQDEIGRLTKLRPSPSKEQ